MMAYNKLDQPTLLNSESNRRSQPNMSSRHFSEPELGHESKTSQLQINLDDITPTKPPESLYSWVVMFASFTCMVIVDGTCFSYGLISEDLEDEFEATKMTMSFAGSLITGSYLIFGPVASGLSNYYNHRTLVMVGGVIAFVAMATSALLDDVYMFIFVFGIIGGFGFSLIYLPACTIITLWFFKKRGTAVGISACGSGIGGIIFSQIVPLLIDKYSWRGCLLMIAALTLNVVVAGALMIPLENYEKIKALSQVKKYTWTKNDLAKIDFPIGTEIPIKTDKHSSPEVGGETEDGHQSNENSILLNDTMSTTALGESQLSLYSRHSVSKQGHDLTNNLKGVIRQMALDQVVNERSKKRTKDPLSIHSSQTIVCGENEHDRLTISSTNLHSQLQIGTVNRIIEEAVMKQIACEAKDYSRKNNSLIASQIHFSTDEIRLQNAKMGSAKIAQSTISLAGTRINRINELADAVADKLRVEISRPVHRQDYFYSGSMSRLAQYVSTTDVHEYLKNVQAPELPDEDRIHPIFQMIRKMINLEILKSPTVILVIISSIFTMVGYLVPYQFIPGYANDLEGLKKSAGSDMISALSLANTFGRMGAGLITDIPFVNPIWLNNFSLLLSGCMLMMIPMVTTYAGLMAFSMIYGGMIAVFVSVRMLVLLQLMGLEKLTNALGVSLLFQGLSLVISTPLLAKFYDENADFTLTFIFGGMAIMISGLLCFPLTCLSDWENAKNANRKQDVTICDVLGCCCPKIESPGLNDPKEPEIVIDQA